VWDTVKQAVGLFLTQTPLLTAAKADLGGATYSEIFESLLSAGQTFMEVWQGPDESKGDQKLLKGSKGEAEGISERADGVPESAKGVTGGDEGDAKEEVEIPELVEPPPVYSLI
jgi:hypothetical protein